MATPDAIRVVRFITRLNIGGPSIQAIDLSTRLSDDGFETMLVHGRLGADEGDMSDRLERARVGPRVESIGSLQREVAPLADFAAVRHAYRLLCEFRPAIVHTHTAKAGAVGRIAARAYNLTAGRLAPARVVHTYHGHVLDGYFSPSRTSAFIAAERALAHATDRLVTVSPTICDEVARRYRIGRPDQHRVVRLGFDLSPFTAIDEDARTRARQALAIPPWSNVVTTVGRLTAVKNHRLFLHMARALAVSHPATVFLIAGDGDLRKELESAAAALDLAGRVRFLGWRRDLETLYAATDVFLLTSRNEGTPVALIESMAAGCAAVSTDVGGVRDVIEDPGMGRVVTEDVPRIAARVAELLDDPVERRRIGERGRAHVTAEFTLTRLIRDIVSLYREILSDAFAAGP
jgi:glycosyltransferase involved in cell wall biosynthesis